jgi:hypothetical protein
VKKQKMNKAVYRTGMVLTVLAVLAVAATTPAVAHVDVYFSPALSTLDLAVGENVSVQVIADVDANEADGIKIAQVGVDFNPNVVNITDTECPCKLKYGPYCVEYWWNENDFSGVNYPGGPYGRFEWLFTADNDGHDAPIVVPLMNLTIERVGTGELLLDISPREFSHEIRYLPSCGLSSLFDMNNDKIPSGNITWKDTSERQLYAGWNQISLPFEPENHNTNSVLASVWANVSGPVYEYHASTNVWAPTSTMDPGIGYFVYLISDDIWIYDGTTKYNQMNISLEPGLNMIGALSCPKDVSDVLTSGDHWYATTFDAPLQKYNDTCNPVAPLVFNRLAKLEPGAGYFISAKQSGWLNVSC